MTDVSVETCLIISKGFVVFFKFMTCLLISRSFGNISIIVMAIYIYIYIYIYLMMCPSLSYEECSTPTSGGALQ